MPDYLGYVAKRSPGQAHRHVCVYRYSQFWSQDIPEWIFWHKVDFNIFENYHIPKHCVIMGQEKLTSCKPWYLIFGAERRLGERGHLAQFIREQSL